MKELIELIERCKITNQNVFKFLKHDKNLLEKVSFLTQFLHQSSSNQERIYCVLNNVREVPSCKRCSNKVSFRTDKNQYKIYCSSKCLSSDPEILEKRKSKRNEDSIRKKREETLLKKTGYRNASLDPRIREVISKKKKELYEDFETHEKTIKKFEKTCLEKYGETNPAKVGEFKEKSKSTCKETYGKDYYFQTGECREKSKVSIKNPEVQDKKRTTNLKEYGVVNTFLLQKSIENRKQVMDEKYGGGGPFCSEGIQAKVVQTCNERYGTDNFLLSNTGKELMRTTYGSENYFSSAVGKDVIKQICLKKYGVEYVMQNPEVRERARNTNILRLGVPYALQSPTIKDKVRYKKWAQFYDLLFVRSPQVKPLFAKEEYKGSYYEYLFKCNACGESFLDHLGDGRQPRCLACHPIKFFKSHYEDDIVSWLISEGIQEQYIIRNDREVLRGKEIDIFLPMHDVGIEFNGLWAHSEKIEGESRSRVDPMYHLVKTNTCRDKGVRLLQIFEDEWLEKQEIVKSIIRNSLGLVKDKIYARKCKYKRITGSTAYTFFKENHLNSPIVRKHNFGLFFNDALVYAISIGTSRASKNHQYEIFRSCSKMNTIVVGGFSKLVNYAITTLTIQNIISYIDKRYFTASGYAGWKFLRETSPSYYYIDPTYSIRENRMHYQKRNIAKKFPLIYNSNLTEEFMMCAMQYSRIWNCGLLVYEWRRNQN